VGEQKSVMAEIIHNSVQAIEILVATLEEACLNKEG
jgi:hypothetical protein